MARLMQLRAPKEDHLTTVMHELTNTCWNEIVEFIDTTQNAEAYRMEFYRQISRTMESHMKAYNRCGKAALCSDEVEGAPWLDYEDNIFILYLTDGLTGLVDNLAFAAMGTVIDILKPQTRRKVFSRLQRVFNKNLGSRLYVNPVCRKSDFCNTSTSECIWRH